MNKNARDKLQALLVEYAKNLPAKIEEIETLWKRLKIKWDQKQGEVLHRYVHTLTGSAGTYGYQELSIHARQLVNLLKKCLVQPPNNQEINEIDASIQELRKISEHQPKKTRSDFFSNFVETAPTKKDFIYFLSEDDTLKIDVASQLCHFDYNIKTFTKVEDLQTAIEKDKPATIIIDLSSLSEQSKNSFSEFIVKYSKIPTFVISNKDNLQSHLEAVRMGSRTFFTKPLEISQLVDKLNQVFDERLNPLRILIVEDSTNVAEYFATILQHSGMITEVINDPLEINQALMNFKPELILMDLYMPQISGLELAAVLRHQPNYESIPIVFLSSEDDKAKQLQAMSQGGDDFITKPISPEYLIWSVRNRAERYRTLRTFMLKDGLTGLFNHTNILTQLENELIRSKRLNLPFCFVIIDLDHFKKVNDTYGHQVGDQVIKSLAFSMRQRLRASDIIGRYGGEEFALILPDTTYDGAYNLCENLRKNFSKLTHNMNNENFSVTFSAGIAAVPPYSNASEIIEIADQALYKAKRKGRNCIV